ncbi:MAG: glycosyl hydrolase family 17 protein [Lacibacter sp.]
MVSFFERFGLPEGKAICYSGFRNGQQPGGQYPSYEELKEDLLLLHGHWQYLRLYDCDPHARTVLEVVRREGLQFRILLGAFLDAEMNNFGCPWGGGVYDEATLEANRQRNNERVVTLIELARAHPDIVCSLAVGNEACVDWTDHYVPVSRVIELVQQVKAGAPQPVTFCENYVPWLNKLQPLAEVLDFISIHTYPVWEYKHIHEALDYTRANYEMVARLYPHKPVIITEAGWATNSNGRGIDPWHVNEQNQQVYYEDLMQWTGREKILTYFFEAFDEAWKGSPDPNEPEKHWGLFRTDRTPKKAVAHLYHRV